LLLSIDSSLIYEKSVKNVKHVAALTTAGSSSATAWINDASSPRGSTTRRIPTKSIIATSNGYGCVNVWYESNDDAADAWLRRSLRSATSATLQRRSPVIIALQTKVVCTRRYASSGRTDKPWNEGCSSR